MDGSSGIHLIGLQPVSLWFVRHFDLLCGAKMVTYCKMLQISNSPLELILVTIVRDEIMFGYFASWVCLRAQKRLAPWTHFLNPTPPCLMGIMRMHLPMCGGSLENPTFAGLRAIALVDCLLPSSPPRCGGRGWLFRPASYRTPHQRPFYIQLTVAATRCCVKVGATINSTEVVQTSS